MFLPAEAMDPVDFNMVDSLSDQMKDLGLGQVGAPKIMNIDVALNVDVMQDGVDVKEDFFHGGVVFHESFQFADSAGIQEVD